MAKPQTKQPCPLPSIEELNEWYDKLEAAVLAVGREMPVEVRTYFARRAKYGSFMADWFYRSGKVDD